MTAPQIPAPRQPADYTPPPGTDLADQVIRVNLHRSVCGGLIKVEVFGDGSTRVTSQVAGRWMDRPWEEVAAS